MRDVLTEDVEARWAQLKDDVIRFSGDVMPVPRMAFPGSPDPSVVGRVRYQEGSDGPVIWISSRLSRPEQLRVLEAAWQVMIDAAPGAGWVSEPDRYRHLDITYDV